jgi:hypothetical protein
MRVMQSISHKRSWLSKSNLHLKNLIEPMLLYTPESNIGSSLTDLHVQFGVPLKHSTIFSIHKTPIHKTKLMLVLVLYRYVLNNLGVPDC